MYDFTLKKEDKDNYITNVKVNEDGTYSVIYASGREEKQPFSIHNYQVELFRMENQVKEYGQEYVDRIWNNGHIRAYLIGFMLFADAFYIKYMCEEGVNVFNILLLSLCLIQQGTRIIPFFKQLRLHLEAKKKLNIIKLYLENQKQFSVPVEDNTGRKEDWYLVDLGNIDQFNNEKELNEYLLSLTPEVKEEESICLTKRFKEQA